MQASITGELVVSKPFPERILAVAKRENTFPNPEYVNLKRMGKYAHRVPATLAAWTDDGQAVRLPRGYGRRLHQLASQAGVAMAWEDQRTSRGAVYPGRLVDAVLRPYQEEALAPTDRVTQGVIVAPTGSGKTMMALELVRRRGQRALVLVHNRELARQWRDVIKARLGIQAGMIGDGKWLVAQEITVGMIQTLKARPADTQRLAESVGLLLVDECHHLPAATFAEVVRAFGARYRYGFTATPTRRDGLEVLIFRLLGEVLATVPADQVQEAGGIVPARVLAVSTGRRYPDVSPDEDGWTGFAEAVAGDPVRNGMIVQVTGEMARREKVLVLTNRVDHAETLAGLIPGALLVHGGLPSAARKRAMEGIAGARVTVGTQGLLGEGLDVSGWSCLVMASPMSGEAPLRQAVGRVIRPAPGKTQGIVVDCVDDHPFAQGAWKKRRAIYARNGWPISAYRSHTVSVPSWTQPVLALDLGTKAGWAVGWPRGRITSGSVDLGQSRFSGAGMRYLAFEKWLDETLNRVSPESVVWEEVRAHSGTEAAHVYGALMGILTATLERRGIPYRSVPVGTWKLGLTGRGNATKDEVMASVRDLGLSPSSQDEADAVGILIAGGSR